jgi:exo-beta-1,3-glucanase (GH17 family)
VSPAFRSVSFFSGVALAVALTVAGWAWLGRPVDIVDVPGGRFECLSYSPATDASSPLNAVDGVFDVPPGQIAADLAALSHYTNCIRTYSMVGDQGDSLALAEAAGMEMLVGIWIGSDDKRNEVEIDRALTLAHAHRGAVRAIVVGNEVLLRRDMTGERLAGIIRSVKARTDLPVTYADIYEFWRRNPAVAEAVDIMTVHVLPYWDDPAPVGIDDVQAHVRGIIDQARTTFPGKRLQIGEIGWPSAGRTRAAAVPTLVNEARFVREFAAQATAIGVPYNLIEGLDQSWKRVPEGTVGGFWGILDTGRTLKFPLTGPVSEWPNWPLAAAVSAVLAVAALLLLAWRLPGLAGWRWPLLGVTAALAATGLWLLVAELRQIAIGWPGLLWSVLLLTLACASAILLLAELAGVAVPRPVSLKALPEALRRRRDLAAWLGLLQGAVMLPAAILALSLAIDGRHRDFLQLAFWLPAAAFLLLYVRTRSTTTGAPEPAGAHAPEGWLALILILAAPFCVDAPENREALVWAATCWLLALPWAGHAWRELRGQAQAISAAMSGR